jgi:phage portal protein BeeE
MFGWLFGGSRKPRTENARLSDGFVDILKSAGPPSASPASPSDVIAAAGGGMYATQVSLGVAREQLAHFKDWQHVAISAVARKIAGQEINVGYVPTNELDDFGGLIDKMAGRVTGVRRRLSRQQMDSMLVAKAAAQQPEILPTHPLLEAIDDPNEALVRWQLLYVTTCQLELTGRAYWWFVDDGQRLKIYPLPPHWVQRDPSSTIYAPRWLIRPNGNPSGFVIDGADVAYFSLPDPADPTGSASPLAAQASAINLSEAIHTAHVATMYNQAKPGTVVTVGRMAPPANSGIAPTSMPRPELTPEQRQQLILAVSQMYAGMAKYGQAFIADGRIESIAPFVTGETDVDWQNGAALAKSRIFQAFGVHPFITGEAMPGSYAQMTVAERVWLENTVNPIMQLMGQVLTGWMGPKFNAPAGYKLRVWFEECVARDDELNLKRMALLAGLPDTVRRNEWRDFAGLPPLDDADGGNEFVSRSGPSSAGAIDASSLKAYLDAAAPYTPPAINGHAQRLKKLSQIARG